MPIIINILKPSPIQTSDYLRFFLFRQPTLTCYKYLNEVLELEFRYLFHVLFW